MMPWLKIPYYFGFVGCASIIAWFVAIYMIPRNWRAADRTRRYWQAMAFAVVGLLFATWNTNNIVLIRQEQTAELKQAKQRMERLEAEEAAQAEGSSTGEVGVVEGSSTGLVEVAETETEADATDVSSDTNNIPAYKQRGKVDREGGKEVGDRTLAKAAEVEAHEVSVYREMSELDVSRANRYDDHNRFQAWFAFWLAMLALVVDYFSRFNKTFEAYYPLPIASSVVDDFCPKTYSVHVHRVTSDGIREYLEHVARKGEGFLYFGPSNPWRPVPGGDPLESSLTRLPIRDPRLWALYSITAWFLLMIRPWWIIPIVVIPVFIRHLMRQPQKRLKILEHPDPERSMDKQFLLETAWFNRYGIVVTDESEASEWIHRLRKFLEARLRVLAKARQTINVIWHFDANISDEILRDVLFHCEETNYKFVLICERELSPGLSDKFEEHFGEIGGENLDT